MSTSNHYNLFFEFFHRYEGSSFDSISNHEPFIKRLNETLDSNHQFFFVGDMLKYRIAYTSPQIKKLHGISPDSFDPGYLITKVHPDDVMRLSRGRTKQMETAQALYVNKGGSVLLSSNFRIKNNVEEYVNFLIQCYIFYSKPNDTVYIFHLETPITKLPEFLKGRFHWYLGSDRANFRYPDKDLLRIGSIFSNRELEIMTHIYEGLETKEIGEKLFLSAHTISTHRRNILKKANKSTVFEVIFELKNSGII